MASSVVTEIATAVLATKFSTLASAAFLFYDYVLTFDTEVEYIWNRQWSSGKALFIFNRYFGLIALLFNTTVFFSVDPTHNSEAITFCKHFTLWEGVSTVAEIWGVEIVLQARLYAIYNRSRILLIVMAGLFLAEVATSLPLLALAVMLPEVLQSPRPLSLLSGCYSPDRNRNPFPASGFVSWLPSLVFETVLCLLILHQAWREHKDGYCSPLLSLLIRDSILYFLIIFAALLVNCLIWARAPVIIAEVAIGWTVAVPCAFGSRLLLNMRERYFREEALSHNISLPRVEVESFHAGRVNATHGISRTTALSNTTE